MKRKRIPVSRLPSPVSKTADLLLEIGTEELPAAYLPSLIGQLGSEAAALFKSNHLSYARVDSFGTPRRLALIVLGLSSIQRKPAQEIRGPSKQNAYDKEGKPTKALLGFLRAHSSSLKYTKIVRSDRGDYVYLVEEAKTTPTLNILPNLLLQLLERLHAPKTMRWDASNVRFARPIRWLIALYGKDCVRFNYGRIVSNSRTYIGAPLRARTVTAKTIPAYLHMLESAGVILDQNKRRTYIERAVTSAALKARGKMAPEMISYGLLDEVTHLVEAPLALSGEFDPKYLELPREVLLASMAKYQRVFAIESSNNKLAPRFVAILEGSPKRLPGIRQMFERILNARLCDSLMFWSEDHKQLPLEHMAEKLSGVTFHERIGSMADKTMRLVALAEALAESWRLTKTEREELCRACQLSKADLVSAMVKEFPTLQGVVGKYYAKDSGEVQTVAQAIEEHYLPLAEHMPKTLVGSALAILDKYDTLSGYFALGITPTGDQDPFGLRRAACGIVEVAWKIKRPVILTGLLRARSTLDPFRALSPERIEAVGKQIQQYLLERLYTFAWPHPAPSADCIDAVLTTPCDNIVDAMERIVTLSRLNGNQGLLKAAKTVERTCNILKGANLRQDKVDPGCLQEPLERELWQLYESNRNRIVDLIDAKSYAEATTAFGELFFEPLHSFFDKVLVNVPDETLRQNRLALLKAINTLYTARVADLSKLAILQRPNAT